MPIVEWENDRVRLEDLGGYRRGPSWPWNGKRTARFYEVPNRRIEAMVVHHAMGGFHAGLEAVERIADFHMGAPRVNDQGQVVGGGKGWPGVGYTFVIPAIPEVVAGKLVVYRIWPDSMRTWHTGGVYNSHGVGICIGGHYVSANEGASRATARARPDDAVVAALDGLVGYLAERYRLQLRPGTLLAHREAAATLCPGDFLADWVRAKRGELVAAPAGPEDRRPLDTIRAIQQALVELGYAPGEVDGVWGPRTARALKAFQAAAGLAADGLTGPKTEQALRVALARPR